MPAIILTIAGWFGINPIRLIIYGALAVSVAVGAIAVRQHYINKGWYAHKAAVDKQDGNAVATSAKVEKKTAACSDTNGYWDVLTQGCKLDEDAK